MSEGRVGIGDLRFHVPRLGVDVAQLVARRSAEDPGLARHLARAVETTGQRRIRFPAPQDDAATIAAEAAYELLADNPGRAVRGLRYFVAGTETGLDHSKPLSNYVLGMLLKSGLPVPGSLASFQVQHACAGGTLGLLSAAALLQASRSPTDTALVVASDVSRYRTMSTAEITQGSGAAAMIVEKEPRLLELDLAGAGYASHDVDDFFRPLGSPVAKVKGSYSMECYNQALEEALADHASRSGRTVAEALEGADLLVLHTPFRNMPELALLPLLERHLGLGAVDARSWLASRGFYESVDIVADIGNAYSASMYILLASSLKGARERLGAEVAGKRVLMASYGSGNVMAVIGAQVAPEAGSVIDRWDLSRAMGELVPASEADYDAWTAGYDPAALGSASPSALAASGSFRLTSVREDGYREYAHERSLGDWSAQGAASQDLRRGLAV